MAVTARLEIRLRPEVKARIEQAAALERAPVSEFVRDAAEERADRVMAEHETVTRVPAEFFDEMFAALEAPAQASEALTRAARRVRARVTRA